jgi:L,D-transpeptidase ErfK/SrfK
MILMTLFYRAAPLSLVILLLLVPSAGHADLFTGGETAYTIVKGDSLILIAAKVGVDWQVIARDNNIEPGTILKVGRVMKVNTRRIVPKVVENGIIINIPDRMLYYFIEGNLTDTFPIGLGMFDWETPTGKFTINMKERNPAWHVPRSIQAEMAAKGEPVKTLVPPGPDNPLGRFALHTSIPGILLHETIWPVTAYQFRSHGCIRIPAERMEKFFPMVAVGTKGELIYQPIKIAVTAENRVLLEVHRDTYKKIPSMDTEVRARLQERGVSSRVNWEAVEKAVREKSGVVQDITL